ncbi:MAG: rRNA pseudouridine synthase [Gloeocapsa sp. DLM2.Bin57]|nr:MAG: rRNA pseudouridine synthase [Gloeocapsa sp. DLM2.Bin57]
MSERVQKILAQWGIASRREAEKLILTERVQVNGRIVKLGDKVDPEVDDLTLDGHSLKTKTRPELIYLLLHKPLGVISTCFDPQQRTTVLDLLPPKWQSRYGIHPVGRLDANSTGALILTNDGDFTLKLTHPRYHLAKTYQVTVKGRPDHGIIEQWRQGVWLDGQKTLPAQIRVLQQLPHQTQLEIILQEGRNRQIRRVAAQLGFPVLSLHRVAIGSISLTLDLTPGKYRHLTKIERKILLN